MSIIAYAIGELIKCSDLMLIIARNWPGWWSTYRTRKPYH